MSTKKVKWIRVGCKVDPHGGAIMDNPSKPIFNVSEKNPHFKWYKDTIGWKVLKEWETEEDER